MNENYENIEFEELKKYYVYELVDSRDNRVFYVGKGQGERIFQHEIEADRSDLLSSKLNRIREIKSSGNEVLLRVIGRYEYEIEAFAVESTMIHWVYGINNLTNTIGGHGNETIRPKGYLDKIEGIDVPARTRSYDGAYSKNEKQKIEENNISSIINYVKVKVQEKLEIELSGPIIKFSKYNVIYYEKFGVKICIVIGNSKKNQLWIEIHSLNTKIENKNKIKHICENSSLIIKDKGRYALLSKHQKTDDIGLLCELFMAAINEVKNALIK